MKRTIKDITNDIKRNVEAFNSNKITYQEFGENQNKYWREIDLGELMVIGVRSRGKIRHTYALKYLGF